MVCIICVSGEGMKWTPGDGGDYLSFQRLLCREGGGEEMFLVPMLTVAMDTAK